MQQLYRLTSLIERHDVGLVQGSLMAGEFRAFPRRRRCDVSHGELTGGTTAVMLHFHFPLETFHVQLELTLTGDVAGQIHRKTVSVVELEDGFARDGVAL